LKTLLSSRASIMFAAPLFQSSDIELVQFWRCAAGVVSGHPLHLQSVAACPNGAPRRGCNFTSRPYSEFIYYLPLFENLMSFRITRIRFLIPTDAWMGSRPFRDTFPDLPQASDFLYIRSRRARSFPPQSSIRWEALVEITSVDILGASQGRRRVGARKGQERRSRGI
jgi:hypothetical protein